MAYFHVYAQKDLPADQIFALQSIHADIAYTLGNYLINKLQPGSKFRIVDMDISQLVVREGLVAQKNTKVPQLIQVAISTADISSGVAHLEWHNIANDGYSLIDAEPIVTGQIVYGNAEECLARWIPMAHFVQGRIEALKSLVDDGTANRLSHNMAYSLFARNLVDYADKYRGMQSVVMHGLEAYAEVTIKADAKNGDWTVPPFFIDSVCHLAGFVMNVSDAIDTENNFCVTPGWGSLRLAHPLVAGGQYRSYVKMIPSVEDPAIYFGDVYILQGEAVIGMMQAMKFRRYPRVLLNRFFSSVDVKNSGSNGIGTISATSAPPVSVFKNELSPTAAISKVPEPKPMSTVDPVPAKTASSQSPVEMTTVADDSAATKAMALVAKEAGIPILELHDDASFANIGVDSLMSLVIAENLREQLNIVVNGSLFLEYPTVGDLRAWLMEYYS